jgi:ATP phosphoribosyltransferase
MTADPDFAAAIERPRLAIQKDGRLTQSTLNLLNACGLAFDMYRNRLIAPCNNFPLAILTSRDDDIPGYVASGTADLGIVGRNILLERGMHDDVVELLPLGFGQCRLVVAVPSDASIHSVADLKDKRIATTYTNITADYFRKQDIPVEIVKIAGGVEIAPALGVADAIADLTATGSSLILHDLRAVVTIISSEAILVASQAAMADPTRRNVIDRFMLRLKSALAAKRFRYIMMNAPRDALDTIRTIVPGLREPTVVPLADPTFVAVHTVVEEESFWEKIEQLRAAGATEILVTPIEKLVVA